MIAGMLALSSSGFVAPLNVRASSQLVVSMSEATRDPAPQSFDNDMSGWKPPSGAGGDAHACGGEYTPTDTPDFLPEEGSEQAAKAAGISYMDGIQGSRTLPLPRRTQPARSSCSFFALCGVVTGKIGRAGTCLSSLCGRPINYCCATLAPPLS